jgi:ParB-like chromosome segregation protein Spo0J
MQMLNLTKPHDAEDFLNFIAHPLANMFPMIEGSAFDELKRDIAAQGILEPIRLYQGMILDGRNRYAAAKACGHQFSLDDFVQWEGTVAEAEAWVISTNLHRRHLSAKQKQEMVRDRIRKTPEMSNRQIAKLLGVSHTMVADERERTLNPPELRRFAEFKRTWEGLSDEHREAFVKEFNRDIAEIQGSLVEDCSTRNRKVGTSA